jgi:hypothetical protein
MQAGPSGLASAGAGRPSRPSHWLGGRGLTGMQGGHNGVLVSEAEAWGESQWMCLRRIEANRFSH